MRASKSSSAPDKFAPWWLRLVCILFMLVGIGMTVPAILQARRDYRIAFVYNETQCQILDRSGEVVSGTSTRSGQRSRSKARVFFTFRFKTVEGQTITARGFDNHQGKGAPYHEIGRFRVREHYPCWYDPDAPEQAVILRRFDPHYYWYLILPFGFISIAGLFLRESFRSANYHSRITKVRPGRQLAWRLSPITTHRGMVGCMGVAAVLFSAISFACYRTAVSYRKPSQPFRPLGDLLEGNVSGWTVMMFVAGLIAMLFVWAVIVNLRWVKIPEPVVEVDLPTLTPGATSRVFVVQSGPMKLMSFRIFLMCEGVDAQGKRELYKKLLIERAPLEIMDGRESNQCEFSAEIAVPADARPSCRSQVVIGAINSGANEQRFGTYPASGAPVLWAIRVQRQILANTMIETDFEIVVEKSAMHGTHAMLA